MIRRGDRFSLQAGAVRQILDRISGDHHLWKKKKVDPRLLGLSHILTNQRDVVVDVADPRIDLRKADAHLRHQLARHSREGTIYDVAVNLQEITRQPGDQDWPRGKRS